MKPLGIKPPTDAECTVVAPAWLVSNLVAVRSIASSSCASLLWQHPMARPGLIAPMCGGVVPHRILSKGGRIFPSAPLVLFELKSAPHEMEFVRRNGVEQ